VIYFVRFVHAPPCMYPTAYSLDNKFWHFFN
jgi:hypothetical protein